MNTVNKRAKFNHQILEVIKQIINERPDLRFSQIVHQTHPYEEPWNTVKRLENMFIKKEKEKNNG